MLIGYDRLLTHQKLAQYHIDALSSFVCDIIFTDSTGGSMDKRHGLQQAKKELKKGDVFVVWSLDRLG